jgi:hypothetical protein
MATGRGAMLFLAMAAPAWAQAAGNVFQQSSTDGLVVLEAEKAGTNVPQGNHTWDPVTTPAGFVGTAAMQSNPNDQTGGGDAAYLTQSPRLDFQVLFVTTGTHYVWVRGRGLATPDIGNNDSCHTGLNNTAITTSDRMSGFNATAWTWRNTTMDNVVASFNVPSVGVHTVNLWMREDGFIADRLLLTTNASYSGVTNGGTMNGPAESPEITVAIPGTPVLSAVGETGLVTLSWGALANADSYTVLRSTVSGGPYATVATGVTGTGYADASVSTGGLYYYRIFGVNNIFGSGPQSNEAAAEAISNPRFNDHSEGTREGACGCGAAGPTGAAGLLGPAALLALRAGRRRRAAGGRGAPGS